MSFAETIGHVNIPDRILALPRDSRDIPIPWFTPMVDGVPDFRFASGPKIPIAIRQSLCWICGQHLTAQEQTFVLGPMGVVNRYNSEPPSHWDCAEFAAQACPFLVRPKSIRRSDNAELPGRYDPAGFVGHNPGVYCLYRTASYEQEPNGGKTAGLRVGLPLQVRWYAEGKPASTEQVMEALAFAYPILKAEAAERGWRVEFKAAYRDALKLVP